MQTFNFAVENCHQVAKLLFSDHPRLNRSAFHALTFHWHALFLTCDAMRATASGKFSFKPRARRFWAKKPVWWISSPSNSRGLNLILYSCTPCSWLIDEHLLSTAQQIQFDYRWSWLGEVDTSYMVIIMYHAWLSSAKRDQRDGNVSKHAIVFVIPLPLHNTCAKPRKLWNVWPSKWFNQNRAASQLEEKPAGQAKQNRLPFP